MSDADKGSGLLPKLVMLGVVILFGVLYMISINDRHDGGGDARHAAQPVQDVPVRTDSATAGGDDGFPSIETEEAVEAEAIIHSADRLPAGSVVIESSVSPNLSSETESATSDTSLAVVHPSVAETADASQAQQPSADVLEELQVTAKSAPQESGPGTEMLPAVAETSPALSTAEADAFAKAVMENVADDEAPHSPSVSAPEAVAATPVEAPRQAERVVSAQLPEQVSQEAMRARIMAEYQAMHQHAQEEMRKRWGQGSAFGQYLAPAYPGYYAPRFYPRRQP